jgi:DNA-directed RNA polymerase specialized sigma24 family protein
MKESAALTAVRAKWNANEKALRALRAEREAIQRELDAELLREQDRIAEAVMARRDLGMTLAEIAQAMECSVGTVSRAIRRWRQTAGLPSRGGDREARADVLRQRTRTHR